MHSILKTNIVDNRTKTLAVIVVTLCSSFAWAQEHGDPDAPAEISDMDHSQMNHETAPGSSDDGMDHNMADMAPVATTTSGRAQGGSAPPDARDPHAYSGGYAFIEPRRLRLADEKNFGSLLMDRLETVVTSDNTLATYDLQAWYGRSYDRVVLKAEGDYEQGALQEASTELLWGHAVASFWDAQLGVRYDSGEDPNRTWLAFGLQGLAPYWFELDITGYIGEEGRTAISLEAEYELLLTQKLILQPRVELDWYGKDDAERAIGSGFSEVSAGIRLRYEIRREIAPYIGIEWAGVFGDTKDYAEAAGEDSSETRFVAGLRFWF